MTTEEILTRLKGVRKSGNGWMALCPAHDDHNPSLSISRGRDGKTLLKCLAGCPTERIVEAMGLTMADLFDTPAKKAGGKQKSQSKIVKTYDYKDAAGKLLFQVVRFDPKDFRQRQPDVNGRWVWNLKGVKRPLPLYRLSEVLKADHEELVFINEGEKDVEALRELGLVATCNPGGAGKWNQVDDCPLHGRHIVIIADKDTAGRSHAADVARSLFGKAASVRIVELPGEGVKDVSDLVEAEKRQQQAEHKKLGDSDPLWSPDLKAIRNKLEWIVSEALELTEPPEGKSTPEGANGTPAARAKPRKGGGSGGGKDSFATKLVDLVVDLVEHDQVDLFRSADGLEEAGYASFYVGDGERRHQETHPVKSSGFSLWLRLLAYNELGKVNDRGVAEAAGILSGKAVHEGEVRQVGLRVAGDLCRVFIDLADAAWRVIVVLDGVLRVIPAHECPIRFIRRKGMLALPEPKPGVGLAGFRELVNLSDDADWHRLLAWMVTALRPVGPYPILLVDGEAGSAKTTLCRLVRSLIDPHKVLLRRPPKDEQNAMIGASNSWIPAFDNISGLPPALSDALCSLATGGGFGTRQLYTDGEEHLIDVARPIMLNGIDDLVSRGDLLDRSVRIHLQPIPSDRRKTEAEIWDAFESLRAGALYELLIGVQTALRDFHSIRPAASLRMADFGKWATAAEAGLRLPEGSIVNACLTDRADADAAAIEASAVGPAVVQFVRDRGSWKGTASDLLAILSSPSNNYSTDVDHRSRDWPKSANYLSNALRRLAPHLRRQGIEFTRGRVGHDRVRQITLRWIAPETASAETVENENGVAGDGEQAPTPDAAADDDGHGNPDHRPRYRPPKNTEKPHSRLKNAGADDADDADDILPICGARCVRVGEHRQSRPRSAYRPGFAVRCTTQEV